MVLGVPILKHFRVRLPHLALLQLKNTKCIMHREACCINKQSGSYFSVQTTRKPVSASVQSSWGCHFAQIDFSVSL